MIAALAALTPGCATIFARGPDAMKITSNPTAAEVRIDDRMIGSTPTTPEVDRSAHVVSFRKDGYEEAIRPVPRTVNPWVFGNILIGGIIGFLVDSSTGNAEMAEDSLHVDLRPASGVAAVSPAALSPTSMPPSGAKPVYAPPPAAKAVYAPATAAKPVYAAPPRQ